MLQFVRGYDGLSGAVERVYQFRAVLHDVATVPTDVPRDAVTAAAGAIHAANRLSFRFAQPTNVRTNQ